METRKQETAAAKAKVEEANEDAMVAANELAIKENNVKSAKDFVDSAQNDVYEQQANVNNASLNLANANDHAMTAQDHHNDALTVQAEKQKAFEDAKAAYEKYVNGKRTMIPTVADAEKELKDAQDKLAGTQNKVKGLKTDVANAAGTIEDIKEIIKTCDQNVSEKAAKLEEATTNRDAVADAISKHVANLHDEANAKKADFERAKDQKNMKETELTTATATLTEEQKKNTDLKTALPDANQKVRLCEEAIEKATITRDDAKADLDQATADYNKLQGAKAKAESAKADEETAKAAYDSAKKALDDATADLKVKHDALMKAADLKKRSEALSYEDAMKNDITDADFAYLNTSTANVKALKLEALNAVDLYNTAYQRFLDAEAVYTDAKKVNAAAIAELAIAQADYDAEVKAEEEAKKKAEEEAKKKAEEEAKKKAEEEAKKKAEEEANKKTEDVKKTQINSTEKTESAKTQETSNTKESEAPKTGDFASPFTFALTGAAALYAGIVAYRKRRDA